MKLNWSDISSVYQADSNSRSEIQNGQEDLKELAPKDPNPIKNNELPEYTHNNFGRGRINGILRYKIAGKNVES